MGITFCHLIEGTTQGDPLAMVMYAIGIIPLIQRVNIEARQIWYADDASEEVRNKLRMKSISRIGNPHLILLTTSEQNSLNHSKSPWNNPPKEVPLLGSLPSFYLNSDFPSPSKHSGMLSVSDTDGNQPTSPPIAHVATLSASLMPSAVQKEHFPPCTTIKLEIYLASSSVRSALMLTLSLPSSHYPVEHS